MRAQKRKEAARKPGIFFTEICRSVFIASREMPPLEISGRKAVRLRVPVSQYEMKFLQKSLDFLYGVLLIGGAPLSVFFLGCVLVEVCGRLFHFKTSDDVALAIILILMLLSTAVFIMAVWLRMRRRLLPAGLLVLEVVLGLAWAVFFFAFFGVPTYPAIA